MKLAFLHVGEDQYTSLFTASAKRLMPDIQLIQCTDAKTKAVGNVDEIIRHDGDVSKLMSFRTEVFSKVQCDEGTVFTDTDMLFVQAIPLEIFSARDVTVCRRSFNKNKTVKSDYGGIYWPEYENVSTDTAWPYLACFTAVTSCSFWQSCDSFLKNELPERFRTWFGDQEAIKGIVNSGNFQVGEVPESSFACLPERYNRNNVKPTAFHFKGTKRKALMVELANQLGLSTK